MSAGYQACVVTQRATELITSSPDVETFDVVIVGSGPAGSSTALYLSRLDPELAGRRSLSRQLTTHVRKFAEAGSPLYRSISSRTLASTWMCLLCL